MLTIVDFQVQNENKCHLVLVGVISCGRRKLVLGGAYAFQATFVLFVETPRVNNKEQEDVTDFFVPKSLNYFV